MSFLPNGDVVYNYGQCLQFWDHVTGSVKNNFKYNCKCYSLVAKPRSELMEN